MLMKLILPLILLTPVAAPALTMVETYPEMSGPWQKTGECSENCEVAAKFSFSLESQKDKSLSATLALDERGDVSLFLVTDIAIDAQAAVSLTSGDDVTSTSRHVTFGEGHISAEIRIAGVNSASRVNMGLMGGGKVMLDLSLEQGVAEMAMRPKDPKAQEEREWTIMCQGDGCTAKASLSETTAALLSAPCEGKQAISLMVNDAVDISSPILLRDERGVLIREMPYSACGPAGCQSTKVLNEEQMTGITGAFMTYSLNAPAVSLSISDEALSAVKSKIACP